MSSEIRCDSPGCALHMIVGSKHGDYVTQYTAAAVARDSRWFVQHGIKRDFHYCPLHGRSLVAIVLRFAAGDGRREPPGIHTALRELGVGVLTETERAVWQAFHTVGGLAGTHRDVLLEAARRVEAEW